MGMYLQYNVIYREKDGGIQVIVSYKDHDGKWRQKSKQGFKRQRDAKRHAETIIDSLKKQYALNLNNRYKEITFGEFKDLFLNHIELHREANTKRAYEQALKWFEDLNNIELEKITGFHIQNCIDKMVQAGLHPRTIKDFKGKITTVFNKAASKPYRIIAENPIKNEDIIIPIDKDEKKVKALTKSELDLLLKKMYPEKDYIICLLASHCGLRIGEILGLQEHDIDLKNLKVTVNKQFKRLKDGNFGLGSVKSKNSNRTVPIPESIVEPLKNYLQKNVKYIDKRIFPDRNTQNTCIRLAQKFKRLGFNNSIHDLRHTYVTRLLAEGADYETIAKLVGDTVETVIRTYSHFTKDMERAATQKVNEAFS